VIEELSYLIRVVIFKARPIDLLKGYEMTVGTINLHDICNIFVKLRTQLSSLFLKVYIVNKAIFG
jgi:hypothetical protein